MQDGDLGGGKIVHDDGDGIIIGEGMIHPDDQRIGLTREQVGKLVMWLHRYMTESLFREITKGE